MKRAKKLTRKQRREVQRVERIVATENRAAQKKKPSKIKPMFSLTRYLARKEEKKHAHHNH